MSIEDWLRIIATGILILAFVDLTVFGRLHFKNKRAEHYREISVHAAQEWVAFMDRQNLNNDEKFDQALNGVQKELTAHGFKIGDEKAQELKTLIEWAVTQLRMAQAKTGVHNTVKPKPEPEIAKDVPDKDIVQPTQAAGETNGK